MTTEGDDDLLFDEDEDGDSIPIQPLPSLAWEHRINDHVAPTFVPDVLASDELPAGTRSEQAVFVETHLLTLAACTARLELDLGRLLATVTPAHLEALGISTEGSYAWEALRFSSGHARELKRIAKALESLPLLRAGFLSGGIPRTRLREICDVATPETEAAWLMLARTSSTRACKAAAAAARRKMKQGTPADPPQPDLQRMRISATAADALFIQHVGLEMVRTAAGMQGPLHELFAAVAADTLSDLGPETDEPSEPAAKHRHGRRCRKPHSRALPCATASQARRALHRMNVLSGGIPAVAWPDTSDRERSPAELDALLRRLVGWLRGVECQQAQLLTLMQWHGLYRERDQPSLWAWAQRHLGMGERDVSRLTRLMHDLERFQDLAWSWRDGRLDSHSIARLVRIADASTESAWVEFADLSSLKRLMLDLEVHRALRATMTHGKWREVTGGLPLADLPVHSLRIRWEDHFDKIDRSLRARGAAAGKRKPAPREPFDLKGEPDDRAACADEVLENPLPSRARTMIAFDAPAETIALLNEALRQVARASGWTLDEGACLRWMFERFAETHVVAGLADFRLRARVMSRDGWECANPGCRWRRHLNAHHIIFRSHGGPDEEWNMLTLCERCHRMLHSGALWIRGRAPEGLLFRLGRVGEGFAPSWWRNGIRVEPPSEWVAA